MTTTEITREERDIIRNEEKALRKLNSCQLRMSAKQSVSLQDSSRMTRPSLILHILRNKFGAGAVEAAYRKFTPQEMAFRADNGDWKRRIVKTESAFDRLADKLNDDVREWHARDAEW